MTIRQDYPREQDRAIKRDGNWGWIAVVIVAVVILGGIAAYRMGDWNSTVAQTDSTPTMPSTTDGASAAPDRVAPASTQNQSSPQGPTGPLNTGSGGAPASNPRGETPPGMQSGPGAGNVSPTR
jgi:hypothetical protein